MWDKKERTQTGMAHQNDISQVSVFKSSEVC